MAESTPVTPLPDNHNCPKHEEWLINCAWCNGALIAPNKEIQRRWRKMYPDRQILLSQKLPTTNNTGRV